MKNMKHKDATGTNNPGIDEKGYELLISQLDDGLECNILIVVEDVDVVGSPTHKLIEQLRADGVYATPNLFINKGGLPSYMYHNVLDLVEAT